MAWSRSETTSGMAAPPPPIPTRLLKSYFAMSGSSTRSMTMVVMLRQRLIFSRWIRLAATRRSQRVIITIAPPV